MPEILVVVHLE